MNIYFAGSIRAGRQDKELYFEIIQHLKKYGTVLTEHVGDKTLSEMGEDGPTDESIHDRDIAWLKQRNVLVAEVTTPSLGVGYEIAKADDLDIAILCLFREDTGKRLSGMINGNNRIRVVRYQSSDEIEAIVANFFATIETKI